MRKLLIALIFFATELSVLAQFSPTNISGCEIWFDAGIGVITNGSGTVTNWADQSGSGNDAVYGGGMLTYVTNTINSKPVVRYGSDGGAYMTFPRNTNIRTVFWIVSKDQSVYGSRWSFLLGDTSQSDFHSDGGTDIIWSSVWGGNKVSDGQTRRDGLSVDGKTTVFSRGFHMISVVTTADVPAAQLSRDRSQTGRSWVGDMAEVIVYTNALTTGQVEQVETYLADKYNMPNLANLSTNVSTWDGDTDGNWSTVSNWDVSPSNGYHLVFPSGASQLNNTNDSLNLANTVDVQVDGYLLRGNDLYCNDVKTIGSYLSLEIGGALIQRYEVVSGQTEMDIGFLPGSVLIEKYGAGTLRLNRIGANHWWSRTGMSTFEGPTRFRSGGWYIQMFGQTGSRFKVYDGATNYFEISNVMGGIDQNYGDSYGGTYDINGGNYFRGGSEFRGATIFGNEMKNGSGTFYFRATNQVTSIERLNLYTANTRNFDVEDGELDVDVVLDYTVGDSGSHIRKQGLGRLRVLNNNVGGYEADAGILELAGSESGRLNHDEGTVWIGLDGQGTHTINNDYRQWGLGGTLSMALNGLDTNRMIVTGNVYLLDNLELRRNDLKPVMGVGDTQVIIDNQGATAVTNTFSGLAEGVTINILPENGSQRFGKISYVGGDGNDVEIRVLGDVRVSDEENLIKRRNTLHPHYR